MTENVVLERLRSFVGTRKKVRLTRRYPSEPIHNGFVVAIGNQWVLLQQFHDFYPEGFTALRVKDIMSIRSGKYERLWERMLFAEGLVDRSDLPQDLPLDDLPQLLKALQRRRKNVIVECEDADKKLKDFYIGQILSVRKASICFANFDALGRWDQKPHNIPVIEITKIQFDAPYVQTFSKYLKDPCPQYANGT